ncbi:MAG: helix-turn-helix domain-containing protein [Rhodospirillales bacterium]|nr:helix-turn-helix domain-containing protein [Rhodospirillales bacterium]
MAARRWHPEDIKAELRKRFGEMTTLSKSWGYARTAISVALATDRSRVVERRIAEALQVPLHELWPDRWNPDGTSLPRRRRGVRNHSDLAPPRKRQKEAAI